MISVIVPTYNRENFLADCIESILAQSCRSFELLIIDDGSTDRSEALVRKYTVMDPRVRYYRQKHSGVSCARNYGLSLASGEYIVFVDSDDTVAAHYLEDLSREMSEPDAGLAVVWKLNENCEISKTDGSCRIRRSFSGERRKTGGGGNLKTENCENQKPDNSDTCRRTGMVTRYTLTIDDFCRYALDDWVNRIGGKMFRRDIISENAIRFDPVLSYGEDTAFVFAYMLNADRRYRVCLADAGGYTVTDHGHSRLSCVGDGFRAPFVAVVSQTVENAYHSGKITGSQYVLLQRWVDAKRILHDIRQICISEDSFFQKCGKVKKHIRENETALDNCVKTLPRQSRIRYLTICRSSLLLVLYYGIKNLRDQ